MARPSIMDIFTKLFIQHCRYGFLTSHRCISRSTHLQRKSSSSEWIRRQAKDPFCKQAKRENWRCRSAFKLLEINQKFNILKPGYIVIDCGAAPGSWTQVATQKVCCRSSADSDSKTSRKGKVISVDLQHIDPVQGAVIFDKSDITSPDTQARILEEMNGQLADVVLSDMAHNATGTKSLDHDMIIELSMSVLKFCTVVLSRNGSIVLKIWMGGEHEKLKSVMERMFRKVEFVKPKASRSDSSEIYLVGQEYFLRKP